MDTERIKTVFSDGADVEEKTPRLSHATKEAASAHTPGPWEVIDRVKRIDTGNGNLGFVIYVDQTGDNGTPCLAEIGLPLVTGKSLEECKANARLIAAAPELLAACKAIYDDPYSHCSCAEKVRAAIAKAEGKQDFWYCSSDTTKEKDRMKGQATHTMKTQTEVETKVEASQMVSRIQDIDDDLCALITETSVGSETDKWLEAAHQHLCQAQQRITRAIELL